MRTMKWVFVMLLAAGAFTPALVEAQERTGSHVLIVRRGWLGVSYTLKSEYVNNRIVQTMSVDEVAEGSPAWNGGLRAGDEILLIDGKAVTPGNFATMARSMQPGDTVRLRVATNGRERDVTVVATERPRENFNFESGIIRLRPDSIMNRSRFFFDSALVNIDGLFGDTARFRGLRIMTDKLHGLRWDTIGPGTFGIFTDSFPGMFHFEMNRMRPDWIGDMPHVEMLMRSPGVAGAEFTELANNPGLAHYLGNKGLLVVRVGPGTPAARAGLEPGDVVTRAGGRAIEDIEDLRTTVARGTSTPLRLEIIRKGKTQALDLTVGRSRD